MSDRPLLPHETTASPIAQGHRQNKKDWKTFDIHKCCVCTGIIASVFKDSPKSPLNPRMQGHCQDHFGPMILFVSQEAGSRGWLWPQSQMKCVPLLHCIHFRAWTCGSGRPGSKSLFCHFRRCAMIGSLMHLSHFPLCKTSVIKLHLPYRFTMRMKWDQVCKTQGSALHVRDLQCMVDNAF